ncbi:MAG: hypothetical protein WA738_14640 [Candidatus Angelobacter sp.]
MPSFFKSFRTDVAQALPVPENICNCGPQAPTPAQKNTRVAQALLPVRLCLCAALLCLSIALHAQTAPTPAAPAAQNPTGATNPQSPAAPPSISLSPAVIMAKGNFGQGLTQTLTLTNQTGRDFAFEMVAEDVIIKDGKRIFVAAGETPNSIAASAVFSQKLVLVKAFSSASVDVRLTLPVQTSLRAIVAMFRGTDKLPTSTDAVGMTASLGALITFNLTDNVKLQPEAVRVNPATDTANMKIAQWIANSGTEPALPEGTAAVLNGGGSLVGKATFGAQRLLPGERLEFSAEYPGDLAPGSYRALCSFQFEGKTLTSEGAFEVPKK